MIQSTRLIIGMEIHVELATRTRMFSRSANIAHADYDGAPPNTLLDPVVLGLPGALPAMNREAVELSMRVGLALGCTIAPYSRWDRKNYFYPDLPKGYQISQYDLPLCADGVMTFAGEDGSPRQVAILRAHLEEDAGKLGHELPGGGHSDDTLVDLNRAGTPLLEIVTQPELNSAGDAVAFARALRQICRFLGVTRGIMQRGHMRFEPNINLALRLDDGRDVFTPIVEIKNLNSFRSLELAIAHEATRQVDAWRADGEVHGPGMKTTRGWDDAREVTFLQRSKEDAHDYRYFPDPDLVPVVVSEDWRDRVAAELPELPAAKRVRYVEQWRLRAVDADALLEEPESAMYFEACVDAAATNGSDQRAPAEVASAVAKVQLNALARLAGERESTPATLGVAPAQVAGVLALRDAGDLGSSAADELLEQLIDSTDDPRVVAEAHGLLQVSDAGALDAWIDDAIAAQPQAADDFAQGKDAAIGRLIGAVMKASGGQADANGVRSRLIERLRS